MRLNLTNLNTSFDKKIIRHRMKSKKRKIGTYKTNKILLSCFDDKRFVLDDGIHALAYFFERVTKIDS